MKPKLENMPEIKEITFPVWRDEEKHLFHIKEIVGAVIYWAIQQSPYDCPVYIFDAAMVLTGKIQMDWNPGAGGFVEFTCAELRTKLIKIFDGILTIGTWNIPKTDKELRRMGDRPHPDNDFIDLGALARNVAHMLMLQRLYEKD